MTGHYRISILIAASLIVGACSHVDELSTLYVGQRSESVATNVTDCQDLLQRTKVTSDDPLPGMRIRLVNWNVKKGSRDYWARDLHSIAAGQDLLVLQEVNLSAGIATQLQGDWYTAFSQGFTTRSRATGVATYSKHRPISECRLSVIEPWLRSRKATNVTEFAIAERYETLLVINVHLVNVSLGLVRFREQMEQIRAIVSAHEGPAILSGDFNTWRRKRMDIVNELIRDHSFSPVSIEVDHRKTFNGYALDHVFVRGLTVLNSGTRQVTSSDHNPINVELEL